MSALPVNFTKYTSNTPITKSFTLGADGTINKTDVKNLSYGYAHKMSMDFKDFGELLGGEDSNAVLGYGIARDDMPDTAWVVTKDMKKGNPSKYRNAYTRTLFDEEGEPNFSFKKGVPGILFIDYDPRKDGAERLTPEGLFEVLASVYRPFYSAAHWAMPSVSSGVRKAGEAKAESTGGGFHLYFAIEDLSVVKAFTDLLEDRLWLAGHGFYRVGEKGSALPSSCIDTHVFLPCGLDYVSKPVIGPGLEWDRPAATWKDGGYLDTSKMQHLDNNERLRLSEIREAERLLVDEEIKRKRRLAKKADVDKRVAMGQDRKDAEAAFDRMMLTEYDGDMTYTSLPPHYEIETALHGKLSVRELLKRGKELNFIETYDPFEGTPYGIKGMFYWNGGDRPTIHSFAHGRIVYFLEGDVIEGVESFFGRGCLLNWEEDNEGNTIFKRKVESKSAHIISHVLKQTFAWDADVERAYEYTGTHWNQVGKGRWNETLSKLVETGCEPVGYGQTYFSHVKSILCQSNPMPLPLPKEGLIPFANGILDPSTKQFSPLTKETAYTWSLPRDYKEGADCPYFKKWLNSVTDGDTGAINLVKAFFNACLVGRKQDLQKFLYIQGEGGTGKSTLLRVLEAMIGDNNRGVTTLKLMHEGRFECSSIVDKRLVTITDSDHYKGSVEVLRAMTGDDAIRSESKYGDVLFKKFRGMVLILANVPPGGNDYTTAFVRRLTMLHFDNQFTKEQQRRFVEEDGGEERLMSEIPGIVNWALSMTWSEVKDAFECDSGAVAKAKMDGIIAQNPVAAWVSECITPCRDPKRFGLLYMGNNWGREKNSSSDADEYTYINKDKYMYPNFLQFLQRAGKEPMSREKLGRELPGILKTFGYMDTEGLKVIKKKTSLGIGYSGIRLVSDAEFAANKVKEAAEMKAFMEGKQFDIDNIREELLGAGLNETVDEPVDNVIYLEDAIYQMKVRDAKRSDGISALPKGVTEAESEMA